ncbi:MAG: hypothetical protein A2Y74_03225 [Actinobacteria bacterium RBG_13_63_9]|nr:MAG: hypothetical protein A2Y74_03225 [Actinobacteria bacterium RBG_13_63_9]
MFTFDPDARRASISRPGEAPLDGQLVCYYPCPRCSNPARALVYLGDAALAGEVVAQAGDAARQLGLLAAGAGLALNGGHGHWGGRDCHLSLWTEPPAALARAVWQALHQGLYKEAPELPPHADRIDSLPQVYLVGDAVGRETAPVVLYRRWSSPSELADRIAGGPWDTRRESYQEYQRRRERAPEVLLALLRGGE